jgi:hypothetical protein
MQEKELTFFRAKIGQKKRIRTVRSTEQKEFESEVSLEKFMGCTKSSQIAS